VVNVVVLSASPEGQEVVERPGELVARVCVDGLEEAKDDPDVHGQDVEISGDGAPHDGNTNGTEAQAHDFNWRGVLSGETEGSRVLMVDLVNGLVEGTPVEGAVHPVVPCVLEDEEDCNLVGHLVERREGNASAEAEELSHGVEEPDLRELNSEVAQQDELGALPLFSGSRDFLVLNLVLVEIGNAIDDNPRKGAAEVDKFVHQEGHDTSGEDVVANVRIPGHPQLLEIVEVYIVLRDLLELVPVCVGGVRESVLKNSCRVEVRHDASLSKSFN